MGMWTKQTVGLRGIGVVQPHMFLLHARRHWAPQVGHPIMMEVLVSEFSSLSDLTSSTLSRHESLLTSALASFTGPCPAFCRLQCLQHATTIRSTVKQLGKVPTSQQKVGFRCVGGIHTGGLFAHIQLTMTFLTQKNIPGSPPFSEFLFACGRAWEWGYRETGCLLIDTDNPVCQQPTFEEQFEQQMSSW